MKFIMFILLNSLVFLVLTSCANKNNATNTVGQNANTLTLFNTWLHESSDNSSYKIIPHLISINLNGAKQGSDIKFEIEFVVPSKGKINCQLTANIYTDSSNPKKGVITKLIGEYIGNNDPSPGIPKNMADNICKINQLLNKHFMFAITADKLELTSFRIAHRSNEPQFEIVDYSSFANNMSRFTFVDKYLFKLKK